MGIFFAHKLDNVVLDTSPVVIKHSLTVTQIVESITEDDKKKFGEIVESITGALMEKDGAEDQQDDSGRIHEEPFGQIMGISDESKRENPRFGEIIEVSITEDDEKKRKLKDAVKAVESKLKDPKFGLTYYDPRSQVDTEHKISKNLAPVLRVLKSKYGDDFYAKSTVSLGEKTFIFTILCAAIYSICNTKDAEINEFQLFTCWDCFKIAKHAGFEIEFAMDRLRKAMLSYFGLGSTGPALAELDNDAAIKDMEELEKKCELLDKYMANVSQDMKALQKKREHLMITLLSNSMGTILGDTIEIVEQNEVLSSWDDQSWDVRENCLVCEKTSDTPDCLGETSEEMERKTKLLSNPREEGQNETLKLIRYSKVMSSSTSDWQENLMNKIKAFVHTNDDKVFLAENDELVKDDPTNVSQKIILDFHKQHRFGPYRGFKDKSSKKDLCAACELPVSVARDKSYHCSTCKIFFHTFCVDVPKQINKHPLHPQHPLWLDTDSARLRKITCNACGEKFRGYGYGCRGCNFYLEVQCLFLKLEPTIQSLSHGKLLFLEEKRPPSSPHRCFACGKKIPGPPFLRCAPCNISLHIQCPLPSAIANTFHEHTLALNPSYFGDADEPHCNICQKQMDPVHPSYSCEVCEYDAHVDCATLNATFNVN